MFRPNKAPAEAAAKASIQSIGFFMRDLLFTISVSVRNSRRIGRSGSAANEARLLLR
jgi:hypothetical protein